MFVAHFFLRLEVLDLAILVLAFAGLTFLTFQALPVL
jgi:hypothetical protein